GLGHATQHAVGDRERDRPQLAEQAFAIGHAAANPCRQLGWLGRHPSSLGLGIATAAKRGHHHAAHPPANRRSMNRGTPALRLGSSDRGRRTGQRDSHHPTPRSKITYTKDREATRSVTPPSAQTGTPSTRQATSTGSPRQPSLRSHRTTLRSHPAVVLYEATEGA